VLADLLRVLAPFAPHIAEELWQQLHAQAGEAWPGSIADAGWPAVNPDYLVEDSFSYPVQVNGKKRFELPLSLDLSPADIEAAVRQAEALQPYTQGTAPKKVIVVPGKIVNVVV
jgi:leucyl-tRNA synthetase